jgi:4-amino-4-deoxy-L-arabinose transferase-like glycosyltransferase
LAASLAAGLVLLATRHGIAVEEDSATYLSAARNLAAGRGFVDFTGHALSAFPPAFPAAIRAGMLFGLSSASAARWVNAASVAGSVVIAYFLVRRHVVSRGVLAAALVLVATSLGMLHVADKALSEPLFSLFVLGTLLALESACAAVGRRAFTWALAAGLLTGMSILTRYAGVVLVLVGFIALLVHWWSNRDSPIIGALTGFVVGALPLPIAWLARNASTDAPHLMGPRVGSGFDLALLVRRTARATGAEFLPDRLERYGGWWFVLLVALAAGAVLVHRHLPSAPRHKTSLTVVGVFVLVYVPFIAYTNATAGTSLDFRIFSPLSIPVVVLAASWFDDVSNALEERRPARRVLVAVGCALTVLIAVVGVANARTIGRTQKGFLADEFTASPLVQEIVKLPSRALVASNSPYELAAASSHQPIVLSPGQEASEVSLTPTSVTSLRAAVSCGVPVYLAWVGPVDAGPAALRRPAELAAELGLKAVATSDQGTLFRVTSGGASSGRSCN